MTHDEIADHIASVVYGFTKEFPGVRIIVALGIPQEGRPSDTLDGLHSYAFGNVSDIPEAMRAMANHIEFRSGARAKH